MEVVCCRWLMSCVGSSSLTQFPWNHLVSYILTFSSESSPRPTLADFLLDFSQKQGNLWTLASSPTECGEGLGQVVSGFLSALKFCLLCKCYPHFIKRMSVRTVPVVFNGQSVVALPQGLYYAMVQLLCIDHLKPLGYPSPHVFTLAVSFSRQAEKVNKQVGLTGQQN